MSSYSTGTVRVRVGSAQVRGNSTSFVSNVTTGDLFKITHEDTWYTVAGITNATNLVLSGRYVNTSYQTSRSDYLASIGVATKIYSGTTSYTPVIQSSVSITAGSETFTDNGAGVLAGDLGGSGTVGYDDGSYSVTLGSALAATSSLVASYYSGDTRTSMPYQIITDYTTNYSIPEMSLNDIDFPAIYTRAMRIIDGQLNTATSNRGIAFFYKGSLQVGSDLLSGLIPNTTNCTKVYAQVDTAASGCEIILDVRKNKGTILNATKLVIAKGNTESSCVPSVQSISEWDALSISVNKVGSIVAGGDDLRVTARFTA